MEDVHDRLERLLARRRANVLHLMAVLRDATLHLTHELGAGPCGWTPGEADSLAAHLRVYFFRIEGCASAIVTERVREHGRPPRIDSILRDDALASGGEDIDLSPR